MELLAENAKHAQFRIMPRYKVKAEGDVVRVIVFDSMQYYLVDSLMKFIILILSFKIPCFLKRKIHNICFKIKNKKIPYLGGVI